MNQDTKKQGRRIGVLAGIALVMLLASCAKKAAPQMVNWQAIGGSRMDGVVKLAYEKRHNQRLVANNQQAQHIAYQRCKVWGYTGAEAFGGETQQCQMRDAKARCLLWQVQRDYQCTDHAQDDSRRSAQSPAQGVNVIINNTPAAGAERELQPIR